MRQEILPIQVQIVPDGDGVTARAGAVLVYEAMRALGVPKLVRQFLKLQRRPGRHSDFDKLAALVMMLANGGECIDDSRALAADLGLWRLIGRTPASPETLRQFLYGFHDETLVTKAERAALAGGVAAYIVEENEALRALAEVLQAVMRRISMHLRIRKATLDHDATVIESHKQEAKAHYKGGVGYQPAAIYWCEADLVVGDEYRDGNVPAGMENLPLIKRGFAALPEGIRERYFRADTACYDARVLKWLADEQRPDGPQGHIGFAIGADMTEALAVLCRAVPEAEWSVLDERATETVSWAEVEFTPGNWPKTAQPLRYLVIRIRTHQGELFANGGDTKYLSVVTNRSGDGARLIRWYWEKAGTIELVHDVMKNELGAGTPPCGRLGANAAWYRLSALTYNVLSALKSLALPPRYETARPKRLRTWVLTLPARIITHAGRLVMQLGERAEQLAGLVEARRRLHALTLQPAPA